MSTLSPLMLYICTTANVHKKWTSHFIHSNYLPLVKQLLFFFYFIFILYLTLKFILYLQLYLYTLSQYFIFILCLIFILSNALHPHHCKCVKKWGHYNSSTPIIQNLVSCCCKKRKKRKK